MTETNDKNDNKKGKKGWLFALVFCLLLAVGAVVYLVIDMGTQKRAQEEYERMQAMAAEVTPAPTVTPTPAPAEEQQPAADPASTPTPTPTPKREMVDVPEKDIDWDALHAKNPDIYAWIYVPGTRVDYPILQHPTDDSFYLNHNVDGSSGYPGCVYTEREWNTKDFDDPNTVLYSHNLRSGEMFSTLHYFEDAEFFTGDHYIFIYRENGNPLAYQIFGAYETNSVHLLANGDMHNIYQYEQYLANIYSAGSRVANYRYDIHLDTDDYIITLSTCTNGAGKDRRWLVQGVLLNPPMPGSDLPDIDL